jgi:hypothetical protein
VLGVSAPIDIASDTHHDAPVPAPQYHLGYDDFFDFAAYTGLAES